MPKIDLTPKSITELIAAVQRDGQEKTPGDSIRGLALRIRPTETPTWIFTYSVSGRRSKYIIGPWPAVDRDKARARAVELRKRVLDGGDPVAEERAARQAAKAAAEAAKSQSEQPQTLAGLLEAWAARLVHQHKDKGALAAGGIRRHLVSRLGTRPLAELQSKELAQAFDQMQDSGLTRTIGQCLSNFRTMWRFGQLRGYCPRHSDPTAGMTHADWRGAAGAERDRHFKDPELRQLAAQLAASTLSDRWRRAILLILSTGVRAMATMSAHSREFELDEFPPTWTVPQENLKRTRPTTPAASLCITLSAFAVDVVRPLVDRTAGGGYLFPRVGAPDLPAYRTSLTLAVETRQRHAEYKTPGGRVFPQNTELAIGDPWTVHDLRRSFASLANRMGHQPAEIERCLDHRMRGKLARIYLHGEDTEGRDAVWLRVGDRLATIFDLDEICPPELALLDDTLEAAEADEPDSA